MYIVVTLIHVAVCLFLIIVILLQSGKAADLAGAFGGMGSQTAFGPRGSATLLSKATTVSAAVFMITSMSLSIMAVRGGAGGGPSTVLEKHPVTQQSAPAKPGAQTPAAPGQAPANNGKQPSVTIYEEGKAPVTKPLNIPVQPAPGKKQPAKK